MTKISYDNKRFVSVSNSDTGEVDEETVFYYPRNTAGRTH